MVNLPGETHEPARTTAARLQKKRRISLRRLMKTKPPRERSALRLKLVPFVDVTDARYGQVLNDKRPTANQCDGLFFFPVGAITQR